MTIPQMMIYQGVHDGTGKRKRSLQQYVEEEGMTPWQKRRELRAMNGK